VVDDSGRDRESAAGYEGRVKPRLVFAVTVPVTANLLLRGQLRYLSEWFDISVISSPGPELDEVAAREGVRVIGIPIEREIAPAADARSLARITGELRALKPQIINASTAKAGLLGMLAAAALRIPARIYQLRGLRLETEVGAKRAVLGATERIAAACAHVVLCNSESLRAAYVAAGFAPASKCVVLGAGSSNGVDLARFASTAERQARARELRHELGIAADAPVIGFIGRPVADKGIGELLAAFDRVRKTLPTTRLVVVGAGFAGDRATDELAARRDVVLVPRVAEAAPYYAMMNVLAFPSLREGFPNAPLEAAAAGVPTVALRVTGVVDVIVDGETGRLVAQNDTRGFSEALLAYLHDPDLCRKDGERARRRAVSDFAREQVWERARVAYAAFVP
jgi:glycosyltransferase involved in cell wall biosynthesis